MKESDLIKYIAIKEDIPYDLARQRLLNGGYTLGVTGLPISNKKVEVSARDVIEYLVYSLDKISSVYLTPNQVELYEFFKNKNTDPSNDSYFNLEFKEFRQSGRSTVLRLIQLRRNINSFSQSYNFNELDHIYRFIFCPIDNSARSVRYVEGFLFPACYKMLEEIYCCMPFRTVTPFGEYFKDEMTLVKPVNSSKFVKSYQDDEKMPVRKEDLQKAGYGRYLSPGTLKNDQGEYGLSIPITCHIPRQLVKEFIQKRNANLLY